MVFPAVFGAGQVLDFNPEGLAPDDYCSTWEVPGLRGMESLVGEDNSNKCGLWMFMNVNECVMVMNVYLVFTNVECI